MPFEKEKAACASAKACSAKPSVAALLAALAKSLLCNTPPDVLAVDIAPVEETTRATGSGLLTVGVGIKAIAPVVASVLIEAPPRLRVLPERYKSFHL